mgnify:CR=1 FL=1
MMTALLTNNTNPARVIAKTMDVTPTSSSTRDFIDECENHGITFHDGAAFIPRQNIKTFRDHLMNRGNAGAFDGYHYCMESFVDFIDENPDCDLWLTDD